MLLISYAVSGWEWYFILPYSYPVSVVQWHIISIREWYIVLLHSDAATLQWNLPVQQRQLLMPLG